MKRFLPIIVLVAALLVTATVAFAATPKPVKLDSPTTGSILKYNPVNFSWYHVSGATRHILKVKNVQTGAVYSYSLNPGSIGCNYGYCSYTIPRTLKNGKYSWWVVSRFPNDVLKTSVKNAFTMKTN